MTFDGSDCGLQIVGVSASEVQFLLSAGTDDDKYDDDDDDDDDDDFFRNDAETHSKHAGMTFDGSDCGLQIRKG